MFWVYIYLVDDFLVCVNCYIMGFYYVIWFYSLYSRNVMCNDCYVFYENFVKKWVFKGMDGMCYVVVFLIWGEKDVFWVNKESVEVIMNNCICCYILLNMEFVNMG